MITSKGREDEAVQGQMVLSSNLNQEDVLKPPILCEGIAAGVYKEFTCSSCTSRTAQQPVGVAEAYLTELHRIA